jgi:Mn2+/Fe2+ NRAMP family transporter
MNGGNTMLDDTELPATVRQTPKAQPISFTRRIAIMLLVFGPGIMVMLADTDAGSVITAAQSGAQWGYRMILPQIVLIPILYLVQEVTIRLGIATGKGHGELIRERFGMKWALVSVITLFIASVGALVTEFSGIAGVGELFGIPSWLSVSVATTLLIALGLMELLFIPAALIAHPHMNELFTGLSRVPLGNSAYLFLLAANVGAVIMPWMVFYQQGAVVDKGLSKHHLRSARWDTLGGSIVTQVIMIAVVITTAATIGRSNPNHPLNSIQQIAHVLTPFLGSAGAKIVFGLGFLGASFVASLVVSVAGAWGIGEAFQVNHSLNERFRDAKLFYLVYTFAHVGGALLVIFSINLVKLTVNVEVMNAMLLPIVLGFLLLLEAKALPKEWRMNGWYKYTVWISSGLVMAFGLYITVVTSLA